MTYLNDEPDFQDDEDEDKPLPAYKNFHANLFIEEIGGEFPIEHYVGYGMREGPAVRVDDERGLVDVIRLTTGRISWDTLGMGYIVYPDVNDAGVSE